MMMPCPCRQITLLAAAFVLSVSADLPARSSGDHTAQAPAAQTPQPSANGRPRAQPGTIWPPVRSRRDAAGPKWRRRGRLRRRRLVLGDTPIAADVIAAANIAARLGFETSAINLPLTATASGTPFVIGSAGAARAGLSVRESAGSLRAGEGAVAMVRVGNTSGVAVVSADEEGLRAAAETLAGRLPHLWDPGRADAGDGRGGPPVVPGVQGHGDRPRSRPARPHAGRRLRARADHPRGAGPFACHAGAGRSGTQADAGRTEPEARELALRPRRRCPMPGVRTVRVSLITESGTGQAVVDIPRAGPPPEAAPGRRPGGGAKDGLDLSSLYTNAGLLGDSDNNLVPDRVDAILVPHGDGNRAGDRSGGPDRP